MPDFEKNRNSLKRALGQLPSYDPPAHAWEQLLPRIGEEPLPDEAPLQEAIGQLPAHTPPAAVWNHLNKTLDEEKSTRHTRLTVRRRGFAIAASLALLTTVAYWVFREPPPKVSLQYSQEILQQFKLDIDWNADQSTFDRLEEELASINDPVVNKLRLEYEELMAAHLDVEAMLKSYGQDPQLIRQMADIERERTDIYRQIIELI
ncbi:MAG: hypothetical protein DA408_04095 [Bacteroidetes bacterium]|nr:MAG: hypothetical protein C7N36_06000 [Bacteroidota bacterium]PTM14079.1 MAG: hypothetical protein DA408_04095 [Bacteroidota bacterium]